MSKSATNPSLPRASYVFHLCCVAGFKSLHGDDLNFPSPELINLLDEVLTLFEDEPRFSHFTLDGQVHLLEQYLSVRPENFEQVEAAVHEGQLLIGPFYIPLSDNMLSRELIIRNLMIGLRTASAFGRPMLVGYIPDAGNLPLYIPQILHSFGIDTAIIKLDNSYPAEFNWRGDDGTLIATACLTPDNIQQHSAQTVDQLRLHRAGSSYSGHVVALQLWDMNVKQFARLEVFDLPLSLTTPDELFFSHPAAYARALLMHRELPEVPATNLSAEVVKVRTEELVLTRLLEPLTTWLNCLAPLPTAAYLNNPRQLHQLYWKKLLLLSTGNSGEITAESYQTNVFQNAHLAFKDLVQHIDTHNFTGNYQVVIFNPNLQVATAEIAAQTISVPPLGYTSIGLDTENTLPDLIPLPDLLPLLVANSDAHEGYLSPSASIISCSDPSFVLSAIKLPEESDRNGLVVRGYNTGTEPVWVTLQPWRSFAIVEVVTMDEAPTGGKLATESNGAVQFVAAPQHILTFWFHD